MHLSQDQNTWIAFALLPVVIIWEINGIYLPPLARFGPELFWLADVIQVTVLPAALLIFLAKKASLSPKHYGLDTSALRWQRPILGSAAMFITGYLVTVWTAYLSWKWLGQPQGFFNLPSVFPDGLIGKIVWIYCSVTAGLVESIFFIGLPWLLYHNVRPTPSLGAFTLLASLIFATTHWEQGPHVVVGALFFGLVACFWYFRLGTLWPVVAGHTLIDLVLFAPK